MSKVLEKVVLAQVFSHLNSHNLISEFQSAYCLGHSTETALLKVTNDLLIAMDTGKVSVLTFLDLFAAFDTVDHDILLHRLEHTWFPSNSSCMGQIISFRQDTDSVYRWETVLSNCHLLWCSSRLCFWANSFHPIHSTSLMCNR